MTLTFITIVVQGLYLCCVVAFHVMDHLSEQGSHVVIGGEHGLLWLAGAFEEGHHLALPDACFILDLRSSGRSSEQCMRHALLHAQCAPTHGRTTHGYTSVQAAL